MTANHKRRCRCAWCALARREDKRRRARRPAESRDHGRDHAVRAATGGAVTMPDAALLGAVPRTGEDDHGCHYVCCDPDLALCGENVEDAGWCPGDHLPTCVTCRAVEDCGMPCQVAGCDPGRRISD
jgi:hypothetical protein